MPRAMDLHCFVEIKVPQNHCRSLGSEPASQDAMKKLRRSIRCQLLIQLLVLSSQCFRDFRPFQLAVDKGSLSHVEYGRVCNGAWRPKLVEAIPSNLWGRGRNLVMEMQMQEATLCECNCLPQRGVCIQHVEIFALIRIPMWQSSAIGKARAGVLQWSHQALCLGLPEGQRISAQNKLRGWYLSSRGRLKQWEPWELTILWMAYNLCQPLVPHHNSPIGILNFDTPPLWASKALPSSPWTVR